MLLSGGRPDSSPDPPPLAGFSKNLTVLIRGGGVERFPDFADGPKGRKAALFSALVAHPSNFPLTRQGITSQQ